MATLLLRELKDSRYNGHLRIGDKFFKVPSPIREAVLKNERVFLTGSLGPDVYPDVLIGQFRIHPGEEVNAGLWLAMMFEDFRNNYDLRTPEGRKVFAFLLGYMMHYACDMFTHTYVNKVVGGQFGSLTDNLHQPSTVETRHVALETYFDSRVPSHCLPRKSASGVLDAPKEFLKNMYLDNRYICFRTLNVNIAHHRLFLKSGTEQKIDSLDISAGSFDILFSLSEMHKGYFCDRDAPLREQFDILQLNAARGVLDAAMSRDMNSHLRNTEKVIDEWIAFLESFVGENGVVWKPDDKNAANRSSSELRQWLNKIGVKIEKILARPIPHPLPILFQVINRGKNVVHSDPESHLAGYWNKEEVDASLGNFGKEPDANHQSFIPFADALTMGKLCLAGAENLNWMTKKIFETMPKDRQHRMLLLFESTKRKFDPEPFKPTAFKRATKRVMFGISGGDPNAIECAIKLPFFAKTAKCRYSYNRIFMLLDRYYNYSELGLVSISMKEGVSEEFAITINAEDPRAEGGWTELYRITCTAKDGKSSVAGSSADPGCTTKQEDLKYESSGGYCKVDIPLKFTDLSALPDLDFDIGVLSFIKSLDEGHQWKQAQDDNPLYYYVLEKLMHFGHDDYRTGKKLTRY